MLSSTEALIIKAGFEMQSRLTPEQRKLLDEARTVLWNTANLILLKHN